MHDVGYTVIYDSRSSILWCLCLGAEEVRHADVMYVPGMLIMCGLILGVAEKASDSRVSVLEKQSTLYEITAES